MAPHGRRNHNLQALTEQYHPIKPTARLRQLRVLGVLSPASAAQRKTQNSRKALDLTIVARRYGGFP